MLNLIQSFCWAVKGVNVNGEGLSESESKERTRLTMNLTPLDSLLLLCALTLVAFANPRCPGLGLQYLF